MCSPGNFCSLSWITAHYKTVMVPLNHTDKCSVYNVHVLVTNQGPLQSQTVDRITLWYRMSSQAMKQAEKVVFFLGFWKAQDGNLG